LKLINIIKSFLLILTIVNISNAQTTKWRVIWDANPDSEYVEYYELYSNISDSSKGQMKYITNIDDSLYQIINSDTVYVFIDSLGPDSTGLIPGELYYYRIIAVNDSDVSSDFSKAAFAAIPKIKLDTLTLPTSIDTSFSLNDTVYVANPDHDISLLEWAVYDSLPGDQIQDSLFNDLHTINFITPSDSTLYDWLNFTVTDTSGFYNKQDVKIVLFTKSTRDTTIIKGTKFPDIILDKGQGFPIIDLDNSVNSPPHNTNDINWIWAHESGDSLKVAKSNNVSDFADVSGKTL